MLEVLFYINTQILRDMMQVPHTNTPIHTRTYQGNDKSILEGQTGGHGEDGVQTAEHSTKKNHLSRVGVNRHASQVNAQWQQVLLTIQGILGRRKQTVWFGEQESK